MIVVSVLVPFVARSEHFSNSDVLFARWSILIVIFFGMCYSAGLLWFGQEIVSLTLGSQYSVDSRFFFWYNTVFVGIALCSLIANFSLTRQGNQNLSYVFVAHTAIYLVALVIVGKSMNGIILCSGATTLSLILFSLFFKDCIFRVAFSSASN